MTAAAPALPRDALMPRPPGGVGRGLALALLAHLLLIAALTVSVDWHASSTQEAAEAELWSAVPQAAAPKAAAPVPEPATPPPQPPPAVERPAPKPVERSVPKPVERPAAAKDLPDAQIAIDRKRRELQEQREAEEQAAKKAAAIARTKQLAADAVAAAAKARDAQKADARRQQAEAAKKIEAQAASAEKQRQEYLKRMVGEAGGSGAPTATGAAAQSAGPSADYIGRIKGRIRPNVSFPNILDGNPAVEVEVRIAPDGRIVSSRVVKRSGAPEWDDAVLRAIDKTEVLPRDENGRVPPVMTIVYRPRD